MKTLFLSVTLLAAGLGLSACASAPPQSDVAPSGIISSNGGGQRQLGNTQSIGVTTPVGRGY